MDNPIDLSRRKLLKTAGAIIGSGFLFCYCPMALSLDKALSNDKQLNLFAKISSILTAREDLSPSLIQFYYKALLKGPNKKSFQLLLEKMDHQHSDNIKDAITNELHHNTDISHMIKKIMNMWYLGDLNKKTISVAAYQQSLVWSMFGSTPPGVSVGEVWQNVPILKL